MENDLISRQAAISHVGDVPYIKEHPNVGLLWKAWIESLPSAQPVAKDINVPINDCISRQAAIDGKISVQRTNGVEIYSDEAVPVEYLKALPSAQPDLPIKEKCAFCPHCNNCDVNDDLSIQPCVDTISRKAAIDAIGALSDAMFKNIEKGATYPKRQWFDGMANAQSIIEDLPSAQTEQRWIPVSERLPEYGIQVLTTDKDGDFELNHIIDEDDEEWFFNGAIAWCELPEPWKGDSDG